MRRASLFPVLVGAALIAAAPAVNRPAAVPSTRPAAQELPADEAGAAERREASPRHGEWVTYDAGSDVLAEAWARTLAFFRDVLEG